ncbi:hypothetical protein LCGC14_1505160 [marine sediment metagenome]|uniref:Ubiquitin-like domain-containing protein n=1 Tax=marine sediment metagenome TaxID=412755 RepID=A0A0F9J2Y8_9ZZZZ
MSESKFEIIFVIQGKEFPVDVNINQSVKAGIHKALKLSGQPGSLEGWELRTESGEKINTNSSWKDSNISGPNKLFLSKGAGRGGFTNTENSN